MQLVQSIMFQFTLNALSISSWNMLLQLITPVLETKSQSVASMVCFLSTLALRLSRDILRKSTES